MKMFHKVKQVTPLSDYRLSVEFVNGVVKEYDVKKLFDQWEAFKALTYIPGLFNLVKVEAGGYGISWNDHIDLACDELFENGV
jgi:hypothetical protein